jgi:preprotein translocase subunit YajC
MATKQPTKLRPGQRVTSIITGITGKVVSVRDTQVGQFVDVNFGTTKEPQMRACRPSQIERA